MTIYAHEIKVLGMSKKSLFHEIEKNDENQII